MKHLQKTLIGLFTALNFMCLNAQNQIIQTSFTPDPAPMVYNDTVYLYTGEDAEGATYFTMPRWRVYSSTDMVNWTDLGSPLSCKDFDWTVENTAWASQCIERNGKFYWYVCCEYPGKWHTVTVAVADHPAGPYKDVLGKPLVGIGEVGEIDPTVYIDDNGQAYLYWGDNKLQYVLLNEDMISYDETVGVVDVIPLGTYSDNKPVSEEMLAAFGPKFEEGPWFYKRDNLYYMLYAAGGVPEDLSYSVSESPVGPWVYKGKIMPVGDMNKSFTNHCGVIDFKGNSYFFYHTGGLPGGGGFSRSTCVEQFEYNDDGTIPQISITKYGVKNSVGEVNPYERVEGETIAWSVGLKTKGNVETGVCVTNISNNDYIKVRDVNFGETGPSVFKAYVASGVTNSEIELRIGSVTGEIIGTLPVSYTGGVDMWMLRTATVKSVTGVQDLYLIFKGDVQVSNLFDLDYWMFEEKNDVKELISINASADKYKLDLSEGLNSAGFIVTANYSDGTSEDITSAVAITPNINDIATVENGKIGRAHV